MSSTQFQKKSIPNRRDRGKDWRRRAKERAREILAPAPPVVAAHKPVPRLSQFIADGWHVLEPTTPLEWNWHIDAVADHLQETLEDWMAVQVWRQNQQSPTVTALVGKGGKAQGYHARVNEAIAEQSEAFEQEKAPLQRIQNLLINIPPGTAKSRIVSVFMPAWMWLRWPSFRFIFLSSNPRVSIRDSVYCRDVVESEWYAETFAPGWKLAADQNAKGLFKNTAGGVRAAFGWNSRITGDRADAIVWDDPHDADEVHSETLRQSVLDRWDGAIGNRVNDLRSSLRIGIMQRLHEEDLSGHVLKQGGWEHLCLPMEYEATAACQCPSCVQGVTAIGWSDPRATGLAPNHLFPQRYTPDVLEKERRRLGEAGYAGQMQQRPAPAGGEIFNIEWWRFWVPNGVFLPPPRFRRPDGSYHEGIVETLPDAFDEQLQSWDLTFKDTKASDYVAGGVWAKSGSRKYLLDQVRKRLSFTATVQALLDFSEKWPDARRKLIEGKANGPAVMSSLSGRLSGMVDVEPDGSKVSRAHAVTPDIEGGDVFLPHPLLHTIAGYGDYIWVDGYIAEHTAFPYGAKDDQVDQTTQALKRWIVRRKKPYQAQAY